jgi:hypothetical protein
MRKLPKVHAQINFLHLNTMCMNMESSLPLYHLEHNHVQERIDLKQRITLATKYMVEHMEKKNHTNKLNEGCVRDVEKHIIRLVKT